MFEIKLGSILIKGKSPVFLLEKVLQQMSWEFGIYFYPVELDHVADGDVDTNTEFQPLVSNEFLGDFLIY